MRICNCKDRCFDYVQKFGFYRAESVNGVSEILMRADSDWGGVFFSYKSRTEYCVYQAPGRVACLAAAQKLRDFCQMAESTLEIGVEILDDPIHFYMMEEFLSMVRSERIALLLD